MQDMYHGVKALLVRELELAKEPHHAEEIKVEENKKDALKTTMCGNTLTDPTQLKGKVLLFPAGTHSLLHKYMTAAVWQQLKKVKDSFGYSFKQAVFSGCKNPDSSVGVYAGSPDSYRAFAPLFDKIIEDYHGHKAGDKHVSEMDTAKLECPPLSEEDN